MKNLKLIYLALLVLVVSCENAYDFDRDFIIGADGAIQNLDDAERLVVGMYESVNYTAPISFNAYASDNLQVGAGNRGQGLQEHQFNLTSGNGVSLAIWANAYNVIDVASRLIDQIPTVTGDGQEVRRDQLLAECYAMRAFMHIELFRAFTPEYGNTSSPSAIAIDRVVIFDQNNVEYLPRSTAGEMLNVINNDLQTAEDLTDPAAVNKYRLNINSIKAFKARIGLYANSTASLTEAISSASDVITAIPLSNAAAYFSLFRDDALTGELIFSIQKDPRDGGALGVLFTDNNNDVFFDVSDGFLNAPKGILASGEDDARFNVLLDTETVISPPTAIGNAANPVGKYIGRSVTNRAIQDYKILRTSEMYLIRAEAAIRSNAPNALTTAADDIRAIRTARGSAIETPPAYTSMQNALDDIAAERRLEMAYEGHRVYDLKRNNTNIVRAATDCPNTTPCTLEISSGRFTLPIPQAEIDQNNAISEADQNPGYN